MPKCAIICWQKRWLQHCFMHKQYGRKFLFNSWQNVEILKADLLNRNFLLNSIVDFEVVRSNAFDWCIILLDWLILWKSHSLPFFKTLNFSQIEAKIHFDWTNCKQFYHLPLVLTSPSIKHSFCIQTSISIFSLFSISDMKPKYPGPTDWCKMWTKCQNNVTDFNSINSFRLQD